MRDRYFVPFSELLEGGCCGDAKGICFRINTCFSNLMTAPNQRNSRKQIDKKLFLSNDAVDIEQDRSLYYHSKKCTSY